MYNRAVLTAFRLHTTRCPAHRPRLDRAFRTCTCPIHVEGRCGSEFIREGLKTASWQLAQRRISEAEGRGQWLPDQPPVETSVETAIGKFRRDAVARALVPATLAKYDVLAGQLRKYAAARGIRVLKEFDLDTMRDFRSTWHDGPLSALKKLERLRGFFRFCVDSGWIAENPAARVKSPKVTELPTLPFDDSEMRRIYEAVERYPEEFKNTDHARRLRALIGLLVHSGLRIGDAVTLSAGRIVDDRLFLNTQKTRVQVFVPLPDFVVADLKSLPLYRNQFFFWTGDGIRETAAGNWRRTLREVFRLAGVEGGHPHRFRDTFAVNLLRQGIPLERVAKLLGHSSVRITEKHYWPWVPALQEQLEEDVRKTWRQRESASSVVSIRR